MMRDGSSVNFQYGRWLSSPSSGEEVVISGISGRFPQCSNVQDLLDNLLNKRDMVTKSKPRWSIQHPELPERGGHIPNLGKFDAGFFGIHPKEAETMDPNLKKLLEVSVETVIDAGVHPKDLENSKTGVFIAFGFNETMIDAIVKTPQQNLFALTCFMKSMLSNRISYFFKVKGPSIVVDSACSSGLTALENAFIAIRSGHCDQALVGGVFLTITPKLIIQFYRLGVLNKKGACNVFDEDANGFVKGESITCIFLQKAKDSKRIYAQIVHCKSNCDGYKSVGQLFPSQELQSQLLKETYFECGIKPDQLSYFEAHGTGTQAGDPVEVGAIDEAIGKHRKKPLWIGSVKSNLGHAEVASGIVSVIKIVLAMHSGYITPNLNFNKARKEIETVLQERLIPVTEKVLLEENAVVGVNNFGFGGANAHVVLRRICQNKSYKNYNCSKLICVSGRVKESIDKIFNEALLHKNDPEWFALIHNIFKTEFTNHPYRGFMIIRQNEATVTSVQSYAERNNVCYVKMGKFENSYKVLKKYLATFPIFSDKLLETQKSYQRSNICKSISLQLCVLEVLRVLELSPVVIFEDGVAELVENNPVLNNIVQQTNFTCNESTNVVFDLSDTNKSLSDDPDTILKLIGRLFERGQNPQIQKIYSSIAYPVGSNAPLISPLIEWNHKKNWPTEYCTVLKGTPEEVIEVDLGDTYHYVRGHNVDGRNLFPASGYLYLVWKVIAARNEMQLKNFPVMFTNCRFIKATSLTKDTVTFNITIREGSGHFEILNNSAVVVTGTVSHLEEQKNKTFQRPEFKENNPKNIMNTHEIYKDLNLRGYNYIGQFRALRKCNLEATEGLIEWQNNWVTFIDNMMQIKILQLDTRITCVPISIQKITIDPINHFKKIKLSSKKTELPVIANNKTNMIRSGGVGICGLLLNAVSKKQDIDPVLEKYEFVPNITSLDLTQSVRINTQIILEESLEDDVRAVEIIDEFTNFSNAFYLSLMYTALERIPLVRPYLTISSKNALDEIPGVKTEFVTLTPTSNLLLVVATKVLQQNERLNKILSSLGKNGFVLSREEKTFVPKKIDGVTILTQHLLENEQLILLRKTLINDNTYIEFPSTNLSWISQFQKCSNNSSNIVVYSQYQQNSSVLGFINCIRREPGGKKIKSFFIMDDAPKFDPINSFYKQQLEKNQAINVYKNSEWGTYRHLPLEELPNQWREHSYVAATLKGDLSSLKWIEGPLPYDDENKNLIYVYYSALNFKDVMISSARFTIISDRRIQDCLEGIEYSGRDSKANRVMGLVCSRGISNIIIGDPTLTFCVPQNWSLEDAATVPCVYLTVIYSLLMRTTLKPGISILIHSATGGIGIAALNVAFYHGCEVFVTVGSQEKRDFLKKKFPQIPDSHIGYSRNTSFEEMIKKQTKGCGVDIVLNSLAEEKLESSVRCLARGGKLLEIGKFDLMQNKPLNLLLMEKEASYISIMLDEILKSTVERKLQLRNKFYEGLQTGYVKPLPRNVFGHEKVVTAFRYMANGTHIGKILLKIREEEEKSDKVKPSRTLMNSIPRFYCDPKKSYIIVGGLGGFGLELADWLVLRGAKKLILTSKFGVQTGYQTQRIKIWTSYGACVRVFKTSTSSMEDYSNLIKESNNMGPTDGIFNLAVVLEDALFEDQTEAKFITSLTPKAQATIFLDVISRKFCPTLRYFVVFSSISCGRGNIGQTNYGMANSVMERICEKRKEDGLPGLAIQWGAVGDVGAVAKMQKENKELIIAGTLQQKISSCLKVMDLFLNQSNPVVASMVVADKREKFHYRTPVEKVARIIGIKNLKTVSYQATLTEMGMDSIIGIEIIQTLERDFGIYLTAVEARNLTLAKLSEMRTEEVNETKYEKKKFKSANILTKLLPDCKIANAPFVTLGERECISDNTIFVFPGSDGSFTQLKPIIQNLKVRVLGVQYNYKNTNCNEEESTIDNIIPEIEEQLATNKPFFFIAYSYGVLMAIEVACYLEKKNYLGKIAAIDGSQQYILEILNQFGAGKTGAEFETFLLCKILSEFAPMKVSSKLEDQLLKCENLSQRTKLAFSQVPSELLQQHNIQETRVLVFCKRCKYMMEYTFTKERLKSSIKLYKAEISAVNNVVDDYGLGEFCETAVEVMTVKGNHETMLEEDVLASDIPIFFNFNIS